MNIGRQVVAARSRPDAEDSPSQESMRPAGVRRKPSTDQKKVRRAMTRGVKKTAVEIEDGQQVLIDGDMTATYAGSDWLGLPAPEGQVWVEIDGDVVPVTPDRISPVASAQKEPVMSRARKAAVTSDRDVRDQVEQYLAGSLPGDYDVDGLVRQIVQDYGLVDLDDIPEAEFVPLLMRFDTSTTASREAQILQAMAVATPDEQVRLAADLDALRARRRHAVQAERDIDLANTVVTAHLTPVRVHERNTSGTDWISTVASGSGEDPSLAMKTEATVWFERTSAEVRADREEFAIQAQGAARRVAGRYGEQAEAARRAFLDHVAHLHRAGAKKEPEIGASDGCTKCGQTIHWDRDNGWTGDEDPDDMGTDQACPKGGKHLPVRSENRYTAASPQDPANPNVEVDVEQSGNAESTVTDYDTEADQEPFLGEDWEDDGDTGVHPEIPGAGGQQPTARKTAARPLYEIAAEVRRDWADPYFGVVPYLQAMQALDTIDDWYGDDDARTVVAYFLSNASTWRGETARRIKAELKALMERRASRKQGALSWSPAASFPGVPDVGAQGAELGNGGSVLVQPGFAPGAKVEVVYFTPGGDSVLLTGDAGSVEQGKALVESKIDDILALGSKRATKKTAVSLTNVGIDGEYGVGTDPEGNRVKFMLTEKDRADLKAILYSDMAINFSGVDVDQADIVTVASRDLQRDSRKQAANEDDQNGNAESGLPQVEVSNADNEPMWEWEQDTNTPGTGSADVADVPTPGQEVDDYPQPTASRKQAVNDTVITEEQAREFLSAPSGSRPRIYAEGTGIYEGQIIALRSVQNLDQYADNIGRIWLSGTTFQDLVRRASRKQAYGDGDGPTNTWPCGRCGATVERWRGEYDVSCPNCGAQYNAFGQRLRDDWRGNQSTWDEDMDDLEGFERQQLAYEGSLNPITAQFRQRVQASLRAQSVTGPKTAMPAPADLGVTIGSIFYSSWGYDQTNINFYEVVALTPASVKVREVAKRIESSNPPQDLVVPQRGQYIGDVMTKRLQTSGYNGAAITINSYQTAWLWDGKPQYQTSSGWGH